MVIKKKWKVFEELIKKIYDISLSDHQAKIQHDVKLKGRSGREHQIDVFIQVSVPLINVKDILSCKYWKTNVKKSQVGEILGIKLDVNVNRATIISRKGFQKGAIEYARFHGINLYKIMTPEEVGVHTAVFHERGMKYEIVRINIQLEAKTPEQLHETFDKVHDKKNYNELTIYNRNGKAVTNIFDLIDKAFKDLQKKTEPGLKVKTTFLRCYMVIDGEKKNINYVEMHVQKRFVDHKKNKSIKDTNLLIHDVVNDRMFVVEKPVGFDILEK